MNRVVWTRAQDVELARRYVAGESADHIANVFGCSEGTVRTRLNTLGVRRRKLKADSPRYGNAGWLIGEALRVALPIDTSAFSEDLLTLLDDQL